MNDYRAYVECNYNSIYHHGIKGQKWGVRRFQNEDGSYKHGAEGRYYDEVNDKRNKKIVEKYRKAGMNDAQISDALKKRRKVRTAIAIGVGAVVIGSAAYIAHRKLGGKFVDRTIKAGTKMNTLTDHPEYLENGHFFISQGKHDNQRYLGMFGVGRNGLKKRVVNEAAKDIKVASEKSQVEVFEKLIKNDKDFAESVVNNMDNFSGMDLYRRGAQKRGNEILRRLKRGGDISSLSKKDIRDLHTVFDLNMVDHTNLPNAQKKYFEELKKLGYGGKVDLNDSNYGGFFTKSATILFDNKDVMNTKIEEITKNEQQLALGKDVVNQLIEGSVPMAAIGVAGTGAAAAKIYDDKTIRTSNQTNNRRR